MENLIPITNQLHTLQQKYNKELSFDIPQIICVGEQSAGKSSVLESVIGKPILPRGTGIVTRCPIIVKLILTKKVQEPEKKEFSHDIGDINLEFCKHEEQVEEFCIFEHEPKKKFVDFEEAKQEIQNEVNRRAGTNKGIVMEPLSLEIHSPKVINLTLVDLPGIVENPTGDQPFDIKEQVQELLLSYMKQKNCIILAVSAATSDIATSQSIQMAKAVDPERERTVCVRTKLDLVDEGTEDEVRKTLTGEILAFKRGIIGVLNRSQKDINNNKTIEDSIQKEGKFLEANYPELTGTHGTINLRNKLQQILISHIKACLPDLELKNRNLLEETTTDLEKYGKEEEEEDRAQALQNTTFQVYEAFCKAVSLSEGGLVRKIFEEILPIKIRKVGPYCSLPELKVRNVIKNREGTLESKNRPMNSFQFLCKEQILRFHGAELNCAYLCMDEFLKLAKTVLDDKTVQRFPALKSVMWKVTQDLLESCREELDNTLKDFVSVQSAYAENDEDLEKKVKEIQAGIKDAPHREKYSQGRQPPLGEDPFDQIWIVQTLVWNYVLDMRKEFTKYCKKACVVKVIDVMKKNLLAQLVEKILEPSAIQQLAQESPEVVEKRKVLRRRLAGLKEHKKIIEELKNA